MMTPDPAALIPAVCEIARKAGSFIRRERSRFDRHAVESKGRNNFVTYVDKQSEAMIVEALRELIPGAGFITEEDPTLSPGDDYNWIVDPLDGTTNFIHDIPSYCVSIALTRQQDILLGVVYEVTRDECFHAWKGGGAFLNGSSIRVSEAASLSESVIATGFPYDPGKLQACYAGAFGELIGRTRGQRRMGAAAVDMAYVACGRFDGYYEAGIHAWDIAAGAILVTEAGGNISGFYETDDLLFGRRMIAGTEAVAGELRQMLRHHFPDGAFTGQ